MSKVTRPDSATNFWINSVGFGSLLLALQLIGYYHLDPIHQVVVALLATVVPIILLDLYVTRVHFRESTGLVWSGVRSINWTRVGIKLVGLWATLTLLGISYWAFQEYSKPFYQPFWRLLAQFGPWAAAAAIPYFFLIDARMREPHDGYWHFGMLVLGRFDEISRSATVNHLAGWIIKGFFLPLMFSYLAGQIPGYHADLVRFLRDVTFLNFFDATLDLIFVVDLVFATAGYILMVRILDSHLRWAEPTAVGWLAAIICYEPFWNPIASGYLMYHGPVNWSSWLSPYPVLQLVWGSAIILLLSVYVWAGVGFGCRFSNLTHRGILTSGAYRFTKHPQYISKNLSWWLISVPWINPSSPAAAIKQCLLLAGVSAIYFLRAKTEERNLRRDPVYAAYCQYIDSHGLFQRLRRLFAGGNVEVPRAAGPRLRDLPAPRSGEFSPDAAYPRGQ